MGAPPAPWSRGLCERVWPLHSSERGGRGGCEQGGWRGGALGARGEQRDRRSDNATAVNIEIDSQRRCVGRSQTHFVLEANVECHGLGKRNKLYVRHGPLARPWRRTGVKGT